MTKVAPPACQAHWPSFRHDEQGSGNYDHDGTPPNAPGNVALSSLGAGKYRLAFTAPGDDGSCGTTAAYLTRIDGKPSHLALGAPVAGASACSAEVTLPPNARTLTIQASDEAGNIGP